MNACPFVKRGFFCIFAIINTGCCPSKIATANTYPHSTGSTTLRKMLQLLHSSYKSYTQTLEVQYRLRNLLQVSPLQGVTFCNNFPQRIITIRKTGICLENPSAHLIFDQNSIVIENPARS